MEDDVLIQISNRIKERRREKNITVQELAIRANVSKGLISQIENSRTVPSLIVLIDIIKALEVDLNVFFKDIQHQGQEFPVLIRRREDYQYFEKEDTEGFSYKRIFTQSIKKSTVDIVLLELEPNAQRPQIQTEAYEFKYIISGEITYEFGERSYALKDGDSMLFDGRMAHTPKNSGNTKASMLVIYFFEENN
ncbi:XRE family transcriptional regulator [uncultured Pedobacter sp.]|uniref:helix-turn-helix domain-containing protein n=1 Tax=uncultured Pedobacter sp. TaxID=246139 RepID=UPI0025F97AE7|nr:XRE family transcriptional regulator [uncultured Pedobacter sp.]